MAKLIFKTWVGGLLFTFGALIAGFLVYMVWYALIQPHTTARTACVFAESDCQFVIVNGYNSARTFGFSPDGSRLITRGSQTIVHDAETGGRIRRLKPTSERFTPIFMGERPEVAAVSDDQIEFFDYDGELLRTWRPDPGERMTDFAALPLVDGFALAQEEAIAFYRMSDGAMFATLPDSPNMRHLSASADGGILAAYQQANETVHIWPVADIQRAFAIPDMVGVRNVQVSADGSTIAWYGREAVFVWRMADGALLRPVENSEATVVALSLSADGARLAVGYADSVAEVWSPLDEALLQLFTHKHGLSSLALSPDGTRLAVGLYRDATVRRVSEADYRRRQNQLEERGVGHLFHPRPDTTYTERRSGFVIVWALAE